MRLRAAAVAVTASQGLLVAGFAAAGRPAGAAAALACALGWLLVLAFRWPGASLCLTASLALGVVAALAGAPGWLPATAAAASLVAWDLVLLRVERARPGPGERRLLANRLGALAAGVAPGLLLAAVLGRVRVELPFTAVAAAAAIALLALDRAARRWG